MLLEHPPFPDDCEYQDYFDYDEEIGGIAEIELSEPQTRFILSRDEFPYPLFCAGMGSGKSLTMGVAVMHDLSLAEKIKLATYAPTYDLLDLITIPIIQNMMNVSGIENHLNKSKRVFEIEGDRKIYCRSMDNPDRIVGYEVCRSHVDEMDVQKKDHANKCWNKIIARNRQKVYMDDEHGNKTLIRNGVSGYTTPEGFAFAYERWIKLKKENDGYEIIKASTYSNQHNLPPDYIPNLLASYPPQLAEAYIEGEFVNLTSGAVYPNFDRQLNHTDVTVERGDTLHCGMDFNVNKMAVGIHVIKDGLPHAVDEVTDGVDTPSVCEVLKGRYPEHKIIIYPDASGGGASSKSASKSDLTIIKSFGFSVKAKSKNPPVKDRVNSVNAMICNGKGERRYKVNTIMCPGITESLEQQVYSNNGEPDKTQNKDHHPDEVGYFIHYNWPIEKRVVGSMRVRNY